MSPEEAHDRLGEILTWAELTFEADPMKVDQLRTPLMTAQMVVDQLVERSTSS